MQKNEIAVIEIEDMGAGGEGIGKADGYTLFVKDAVIGDVVEVKVMKAKKHYGYARLMKIVKPSDQRVAARCPEARRCGGCQIQEMDYQAQLAFKNRKVRNHLLRLGEVPEELLDRVMEPVCGMEEPFRYRNKAQFPVGRDREGNLTAGFYAGRTHSIIPVPELDCLLGAKENQKILRIILEYMKEYGVEPYDEESGRGLVRHVLLRKGFSTGELMVCLVINGRKLPRAEALIGRLKEIPGMTSISCSVNMERTNVIMGSEILPLYGKDYITDRIGPVKYQISPLSFYQVNHPQAEALYREAVDMAGLDRSQTALDLYCGIGTITLHLAERAGRAIGAEIVPQAVEDARENARRAGMDNVRFLCADAGQAAQQLAREGLRPDVIVVDPPRKGIDGRTIDAILQMAPARVVYIACDCASLARDAAMLCDKGGYGLTRVRAFDMFPRTANVETAALLCSQ